MTLQDLQRLDEWLKKMDPDHHIVWVNRTVLMKKFTTQARTIGIPQ